MNRFTPFENAADMAKHCMFTADEIIKRASSENEYDKRIFNNMVNNAIQHKAYHDTPEAVRAELIVSESIDISKTWRKASKCERGGNSQVSYRSVANHKRAKVV